MSLRSRLFGFFVVILVVPLTVAAFFARAVTVRELERRTSDQLRAAGGAAAAIYQQRITNAPAQTRLIAGDPDFLDLLVDGRFPELQAHLDRRFAEGALGEGATRLDYLVVSDAQRNVLARVWSPSDFLPGVDPPIAEDVTAPDPSRLITRAEVPIQAPAGDQILATVFGGYYIDNEFIEPIAESTAVDVTFFVRERAVASTVASTRESGVSTKVTLFEDQTFFKATMGTEGVYAAPIKLSEDIFLRQVALVVSTPSEPVANLARVMTVSLGVLLLVMALVAMVLGYVMTRGITRPLTELAAGANAISAGDYELDIEVRSHDEVGELASAFNEMAKKLSVHIAALEESREEVKRALTRFGETLRSTHDLEQLLTVIVETSMDHLQAQRGMLMLLNRSRDRLVVRVHRGVQNPHFDLAMGEGLAGHVAQTGAALRLPGGGDATPSRREPSFRTAMMVPIFTEERVVGVLALYDKAGGEVDLNFTEVDMASLLSLADQAGVAIENVFLHDQARQLSVVDSVVGIWNRRYFTQRAEQELERSARFGRPFSLLLIDIDDFKVVNDSHGHQRGDSVLIEVAQRVKGVIREIDVLARFGGEEFVLILPETDAEGGVATGEKIRQAIGSEAFDGDPPVSITVSVGVACYWEHGKDQETLIRAADAAMYKAKRSGKDQVVLFDVSEAPA